MSKRKRVPAPFQRILPSVIRTFGPRLILIAGGVVALLILLTGGSYLLSRVSPPPKAPVYRAFKKVAATALPKAQVLRNATTGATNPSYQTTTARNDTKLVTPVVAVPQTDPTSTTPPGAPSSPQNSSHTPGGNNSQGLNNDARVSIGTTIEARTPLGSVSLHLPLGL